MIMKSFDTDIQKITQKARLKAAERSELRERVLAYMEYHPLAHRTSNISIERTPALAGGFLASSKQFLSRAASFHTLYTRIGAGVFALLLIVSVPFAAEDAAPGDMLYPIKTQVNEAVLSQFNNSPYQKVAFETELMERRIAEARLLAKEGKLNDKTEAALAMSIAGHANAAQESINSLKENDAEGAAIAEITFGSVLDVQTAVLDSGTTTMTDETSGIAGAVRNAKFAADAQKGSTTPSYERLMAHMEQETTRAHELFNAIKASATEEEKADIDRRLADLERKITSAQEAHATLALGDEVPEVTEDAMSISLMAAKAAPADGAAILGSSLGDLKKLIVFMTDIDVRNSVTLESLVPLVPTVEEEAEFTYNDLVLRYAALETSIESGSEEIGERYSELGTLIETASTSRAVGNIAEMQAVLPDITFMLEDIEIMLFEEGISL